MYAFCKYSSYSKVMSLYEQRSLNNLVVYILTKYLEQQKETETKKQEA